MNINRREFLMLTTALAAAGCQVPPDSGRPPNARKERVINAGPVSAYASDGVYDRFRDQGFFVIRRDQKLFALSAICTHRKCKLEAQSDHSFYCPCHGSTFTTEGKVTQGPARRDLPALATFTDENGQLFVRVPVR